MNPAYGGSLQMADEFWDVCVCAPACPWSSLTLPAPLGHCYHIIT